jgi:hypothetical protein
MPASVVWATRTCGMGHSSKAVSSGDEAKPVAFGTYPLAYPKPLGTTTANHPLLLKLA